MNTQDKIFAKLSSLSKGKLERKENLGAIEDAINESKFQLKENSLELSLIVDSLNEEINNVVAQIAGLMSGLDAIVNEHKYNFEAIEAQFDEKSAELDDLGIEFDTPFPDISYELQENLNYALRITKLDLQ